MEKFSLQDHKIPSGFTAPKEYFAHFSVDPQPEVRKLNLMRHWFAAAAVLVIALSIPALNVLLPQTSSANAVEDYLVYEMPVEDVIGYLETEDLESMSAGLNIDHDNLEEFLVFEDVENLIY